MSLAGKPLKDKYKTLITLNQSSNTGFENSSVKIVSGDGGESSASLGKAGMAIKPTSTALDATSTLNVQTASGNQIFQANTNDSTVKAGASLFNVTSLVKNMGVYEFSPNSAGYHYPVIANNIGMQGAEAYTFDDDWGNGTDPATSLDVSGLTDPENAIAIYWYIQHNITLDAVRYIARADGVATLNMHLLSYDIDTSTNYGDLSNGVVCASGSVPATSTGIKTSTLTLDSANINSGKVVIAFVENASSTDDYSVVFDCYYHVR